MFDSCQDIEVIADRLEDEHDFFSGLNPGPPFDESDDDDNDD